MVQVGRGLVYTHSWYNFLIFTILVSPQQDLIQFFYDLFIQYTTSEFKKVILQSTAYFRRRPIIEWSEVERSYLSLV